MLMKRHRPYFIFLSEVKCHDVVKIQNLVKSISFDCFKFVHTVGKSEGLLLAWKSSFNLNIVNSATNFINYLVFANVDISPWQITFVYGPPTPAMIQYFWDSLDEIGQSFIYRV